MPNVTNVTTAVEIIETLLNLPAQLDRIEAAAIARQPIDVTIIAGELPPTGYFLEPIEFTLIRDGEHLGNISTDYRAWTWRWSQGSQTEGTWELHRGQTATQEEAITAIIERRLDPSPYRPTDTPDEVQAAYEDHLDERNEREA